MRFVCVSDTHELHCELLLSHGDLLIHAGDFSFAQISTPLAALRNFNDCRKIFLHYCQRSRSILITSLSEVDAFR